MSLLMPQFQRGGICLPSLQLWLDAQESRTGPERVFVSHAHSDHIGRHREVILTQVTARLMRERLGGERLEHHLPWREPRVFEAGSLEYRVTLFPAGHIFGSAMSLIEAGGESLLYTGDFKLRPGCAAEPCEPCRADYLIMETTFGLPKYRFPSADEVFGNLIRFCREALERDEIPVLLVYSLGKCQELLRGLMHSGLPFMLHPQAHKLTEICAEFGQQFPAYESFDAATASGKVLILPPGSKQLAALAESNRLRTAVVTGWALDSSCRYRAGVDAAFPLSDHADFPELVEFVKRVSPRRVYTVHGFATEFASTLRDLGFDARALGREEQLSLLLT